MDRDSLLLDRLYELQETIATKLTSIDNQIQSQNASNDVETLYWLFSTTPQVLAALLMIILTGAVFAWGAIDQMSLRNPEFRKTAEKRKKGIKNASIYAMIIFVAAIAFNLLFIYNAQCVNDVKYASFIWTIFFILVLASVCVMFVGVRLNLDPCGDWSLRTSTFFKTSIERNHTPKNSTSYLKLFFCCLTITLIFVGLFAIVGFYPNCQRATEPHVHWTEITQAFAALGTFLVSCIAICYAYKEYKLHLDINRTAMLTKYLERFTKDENIKAVTAYIIAKSKTDEKGNITGFDNEKQVESPSVNQKEMFMHFFEEIQLLVERKVVNADDTIELTGYYAGIFHRIKEFREDVTDYDNKQFWNYYLNFVNSIPDSFYPGLLRDQMAEDGRGTGQ